MTGNLKYAVVTGASRGIGLEFTRQLLTHFNVCAVARHPEGTELVEVNKNSEGRLKILALDLEDSDAPTKLRAALEAWPKIDLLINNAGILHQGFSNQELSQSFQVNAIALILILNELKDLLQKSTKPKAVHISSQMGSIRDNLSGGYYAYRASKAALNMLVKSVAIDEPWLISTVLHPGWVKTRMGGNGALITASDSVHAMLELIDGLEKSDSGKFLTYQGELLSW
jgi:NAD(P)-dependent dehydrogenase (short-subunit alcohol dehydrogenase family)